MQKLQEIIKNGTLNEMMYHLMNMKEGFPLDVVTPNGDVYHIDNSKTCYLSPVFVECLECRIDQFTYCKSSEDTLMCEITLINPYNDANHKFTLNGFIQSLDHEKCVVAIIEGEHAIMEYSFNRANKSFSIFNLVDDNLGLYKYLEREVVKFNFKKIDDNGVVHFNVQIKSN